MVRKKLRLHFRIDTVHRKEVKERNLDLESGYGFFLGLDPPDTQGRTEKLKRGRSVTKEGRTLRKIYSF